MAKISEETKQYYIEMTKLIISSYIDLLRDYLKKGKLKKADKVVDKIYERFLDIIDWQNLKFKNNEYDEFEEEINDFEKEDEENENDWTKNCTENEENQNVEKDIEEIKPKRKTTYHSNHRDDDDD